MDLKDKWRNLQLALERLESRKGSDDSDIDTPNNIEANEKREAEMKDRERTKKHDKARKAAEEEAKRAAMSRMNRDKEEKERKRAKAASFYQTNSKKTSAGAFSRAATMSPLTPKPPSDFFSASLMTPPAKRHLAFSSRVEVGRRDEQGAMLSVREDGRKRLRIWTTKSGSGSYDDESD